MKQQLSNSNLKDIKEKSHVMDLEELEHEEEEQRAITAESKKQRIKIVKRFRKMAKSTLKDNETNQKLLRIQAWFSDQGLSPRMVNHWYHNDDEFKEIYDEGKKHFAELNYVGMQTHYLKESSTMYLLPYYSDEFKKHREWEATLKALANAPHDTHDDIMKDIAKLLEFRNVSAKALPTTTD